MQVEGTPPQRLPSSRLMNAFVEVPLPRRQKPSTCRARDACDAQRKPCRRWRSSGVAASRGTSAKPTLAVTSYRLTQTRGATASRAASASERRSGTRLQGIRANCRCAGASATRAGTAVRARRTTTTHLRAGLGDRVLSRG